MSTGLYGRIASCFNICGDRNVVWSVSPKAAVIPLPRKILPAKFKSAHLEFVVLPESPVLRLVAYPVDGSGPKVKTIVTDIRIASTIEPKVAGYTYSPAAACLVIETRGPGAYASRPSGIQLVPMDKVKKALAGLR